MKALLGRAKQEVTATEVEDPLVGAEQEVTAEVGKSLGGADQEVTAAEVEEMLGGAKQSLLVSSSFSHCTKSNISVNLRHCKLP